MTFVESSRAVARDFLQSVVVFDDFAHLEDRRLSRSGNDEHETTSEEADVDPYGSAPEELITPSEPETERGEIGVDVKRLSDAFAELGLVCGFLKPNPEEGETEGRLLLDAARRADVVVLDWVIERDEGETARRLVADLLRSDKEQQEQRLRLIVIYTAQDDLKTIAEQLAQTLEQTTGESPDAQEFVVTAGAARIVVLAKEASRATGEAADRRVSEDELPVRVIEAFAEFTMGLVPNVVLAGLSAVRADTHRILQVFDRHLDPAYLAQRLLLPDPAEAEEQLVDLLASELQSVMEDREVDQHAGIEAVMEWVEWQHEVGTLPLWKELDRQVALEYARALLTHGLLSEEPPVPDARSKLGLSKNKAHLKAAHAFADDADRGDLAQEELAMRFALRTYYSRPDRVLQLGTIVRLDGEYLLCVQPVCDSLRIDGERSFPFLPLIEKEDGFDLVLKDEKDNRVTLEIDRKPHRLRHVEFSADPSKRCVVAVPGGGEYAFESTDSKQHCVWIARLQDVHGQRVAYRLGTEFGRVGLFESEWLRTVAGAED